MRNFNLYLIILLISLASCSPGTKKSAPSLEQATFLVDPIQGSAETAAADTNFSSIPKARQFQYTACIKDVGVLEPVIGQSFAILDGNTELRSLTTDAKGCLYWTESLSFQATGQEKFLEIVRTIEARAKHKGRQTIHLALNPWQKGSQVLDLRFRELPLSAKTQPMTVNSSALFVDSISADLELKKSESTTFELRISFSPKWRHQSLDSGLQISALTEGRLKFQGQLFANYSGATSISAPFDTEVNVSNGEARIVVSIPIQKKFPKESILELHATISSAGEGSNLGAISGIASLGRLTNVVIHTSAQLREEKVAFQALNLESLSQQDHEGSDYNLGRITSERAVVKSIAEDGHPEVVIFSLKACLKNAFSEEAILQKHFKVEANQSYELITDPENGCLHWDHEVAFNYFDPEKFFPVTGTITSQDSFYGKSRKAFSVYLNPWQISDSSLSVIDDRFQAPPSNILAKQETARGLRLTSLGYTFLERSFAIDPSLNLSTIRTYRFELRPTIPRLSLQGWQDDTLGNGKYRVRFLLETGEEENATVIDDKTLTAESVSGALLVNVPFRFNDLRYVNNRLSLTVHIQSISNKNGFKSQPQSSPIDLLGGNFGRFEPRKRAMPSISESAKNPSAADDSIELLKRLSKALPLENASAKLSRKEFSDEAAFFQEEKGPDLAKFCELFYEPGWFTNLKACTRSPQDYLKYSLTEHLMEIKKSSLQKTDTSALTMSASVSQSSSESDSKTSGHTDSINFSADAGLKVPLLDFLGLSLGVSVGYGHNLFYTSSYSKSNSRTNSNAADLSRSLTIDEAKIAIEGTTKKCVWISAARSGAMHSEPIFLCQKTPSPKTFSEDYYFLYRPIQASALQDSQASYTTRPFMALIRGQKRFENFLKLLQNSQLTINLEPDHAKKQLDRLDGYVPGLLNP